MQLQDLQTKLLLMFSLHILILWTKYQRVMSNQFKIMSQVAVQIDLTQQPYAQWSQDIRYSFVTFILHIHNKKWSIVPAVMEMMDILVILHYGCD